MELKSDPKKPLEGEVKDKAWHFEIDKNKLETLPKPGIVGHQWRQKGPYLVCSSCPIKHAVWIGMERQLIGFNEDGTPLLRRIEKRS